MQSSFSKTVTFGRLERWPLSGFRARYHGFAAFLARSNYLKTARLRMLTTPQKHFDVSLPRSHCNVKQLMLISSCAVVERTVTRCDGKLKPSIVTQKLCGLELKGGIIFWAERKSGEMDPSCRWGGKSSSRFESRLAPTGLPKQLCPASTSSIETPQTLPPPRKRWNRPNEQHEHFISSLRNFILRYFKFYTNAF